MLILIKTVRALSAIYPSQSTTLSGSFWEFLIAGFAGIT